MQAGRQTDRHGDRQIARQADGESDHQHVITGDLEIVSDIKLRNLISKGPNYREPVLFSCSKGKEEILKGIDNCITAWSNKEGLHVGAFADWKT